MYDLQDTDIERRLHDLNLDFEVVTSVALSRPLQLRPWAGWRLRLWVPRQLVRGELQAAEALSEGRLPLALATGEVSWLGLNFLKRCRPRLEFCGFSETAAALEIRRVAAFLPDFFPSPDPPGAFFSLVPESLQSRVFTYSLAWNPRLLRLNPHAARRRDSLVDALTRASKGAWRTAVPHRPLQFYGITQRQACGHHRAHLKRRQVHPGRLGRNTGQRRAGRGRPDAYAMGELAAALNDPA